MERVLALQPLPTWICRDSSFEVVAANRAAAALLGQPTPAIIGFRLLAEGSAVPLASEGAVAAWLGDLPEGETVCLLRRPDGSTIGARLSARRLGTAPDDLLWVSASAPPPAAGPMGERRSEEQLLRDAKRESLELLAGGVAHDFNNLLTALMGNLSMARMDSGLSGDVQEWLAEAEKAALRARDLTQQLLAFSKGGEPVRRLVSLAEVVREAAKFARQGSRVRCEFALPAELWPAEVDTGQIGQIVHNLVLNAVQAMPRGGVITLSARNVSRDEARHLGLGRNHFVVVEVRDEGPGIQPEDMARIFQPYFTTKRHGSGLGLATSQTIARRHFGALRVESEPGRGAAFRLYLPAKPGVLLAASAVGEALPALRGCILFMDDEAAIRQMAPDLFGRLGLTADVVGDGRDALETYARALAAGRRYDAVVLDLTVPAGMGAMETLQGLRALDPAVRVLVSSGYADDPVLLEHRTHGFCGAVTKPYCIQELATVMGRALVRAEGERAPIP